MPYSRFKHGLLAIATGVISTSLFATEMQLPTDFPESLVTSHAVKSGITKAWYDGATTRYAHGVLGDAVEAGELHAETIDGQRLSFTLELQQVFEDVAPRLADINGDGRNEIITIRSHNQKGGQIAVYGVIPSAPNTLSLIASTPYIGQPYRWLAPVGVADFNNDGAMDIAYIDRPHLAKILRVWSFTPKGLQQIAQKSGLTNHQIGHDYITGGVQRCSSQPAMITVDSTWQRLIKTTLENGKLTSEDIGPYANKASAEVHIQCH
ncbi:MAG: FG-GAP repeat domain-containing protein [Leucothrix sp.]